MSRPLLKACATPCARFPTVGTGKATVIYHPCESSTVETGALLHAPSGPELAGWKARKTLVGLALLVAAALGTFVGIKGMDGGGSAGDGTVLVTLVTIGASVAIGYFGLRYLMIGVKGQGVKLFEAAVEADFFKGPGIVPRRRTVPLLHIRVSGSSRLTFAQAITTTGHAFRLPPVLVEESDLWYLGSLGTRPLAPGGREAKELYESGDLMPYEHPSSDPLPDHGPAWPDPGTLPITVEVPIEPEVVTPVEASAPPREPPGRISTSRAPPAPTPQASVAMDLPERSVPPAATAAPSTPPPEPEMEVVMDLPDVVTPPETPRVRLPPPPMVRPASISVREPPAHRPMDRDEPSGPPEPPPEAPPETPPGPKAPPVAGPGPSPPATDEWELEELPPPRGERKGKTPQQGWDWEEI
jgi:hypothetical protein